MFWFIAVFVVALVVAYASAPKPQTQPPPGIGKIQVPTANDGREIPVLFGTRVIRGPNVVWYGNMRTVPIIKTSSGGGKK